MLFKASKVLYCKSYLPFLILGMLKLKEIIQYERYILALKYFHSASQINLNLYFKLKYSPYAMRSTNNFIEYVCKSNTGLFNVNKYP